MDVEIVRFLGILLYIVAFTGSLAGLLVITVSYFKGKNVTTLTIGYVTVMFSLGTILALNIYNKDGSPSFPVVGATFAVVVISGTYLFAYAGISSEQNKATPPSEAVTTDAAS